MGQTNKNIKKTLHSYTVNLRVRDLLRLPTRVAVPNLGYSKKCQVVCQIYLSFWVCFVSYLDLVELCQAQENHQTGFIHRLFINDVTHFMEILKFTNLYIYFYNSSTLKHLQL